MKRRKFIKKSLLTTLGLGFLTGMYSWQIEPFWLEFVHKKMPLKNLPKHLIGKTLIQISDLHIGTKFDYQYIINSFEKTKKLNPDFVVYTGDYTTYETEKQFTQLQEVLQHVVLGKLGTYGILGNHDYGHHGWNNSDVANKITEICTQNGINILRNEAEENQGINFMGIDDYWGTNFHPKKALQYFDKEKANLVLCHNPDVCDQPVWNHYNSWILSGHTHGGQIKPPFLKPPILPVKNKRYTAGEIDLYDGRTLYINRALGCIKQIRFNVRPEITIFTLTKANS